MSQNPEKPVFSLVHGRFHSDRCWIFVQQELRNRGYHSIATNLDIEDGSLSVDDHARVLREAEAATGAEHIYRLGHSWGANVVVRELTDTVRGIGFLAGVFNKASVPHVAKNKFPKIKHSAQYEIIIRNPEKLRGMADVTFYHDVNPMRAAWAISQLRDHPRRETEPALKAWPDVPMAYIPTSRDKTVVYASQIELAQAVGITTTSAIESGHTPMISQYNPEMKSHHRELAAKIIDLANR